MNTRERNGTDNEAGSAISDQEEEEESPFETEEDSKAHRFAHDDETGRKRKNRDLNDNDENHAERGSKQMRTNPMDNAKETETPSNFKEDKKNEQIGIKKQQRTFRQPHHEGENTTDREDSTEQEYNSDDTRDEERKISWIRKRGADKKDKNERGEIRVEENQDRHRRR